MRFCSIALGIGCAIGLGTDFVGLGIGCTIALGAGSAVALGSCAVALGSYAIAIGSCVIAMGYDITVVGFAIGLGIGCAPVGIGFTFGLGIGCTIAFALGWAISPSSCAMALGSCAVTLSS